MHSTATAIAASSISVPWPSRVPRPENERMSPVASFRLIATRKKEQQWPLTAQQAVIALRDGGMPISAIAEAMHVQRKTIYSWLDGGEVREGSAQRVALVYSLLTRIPGVDVRSLYRFWNTPVSGEKTLRDLMCVDSIDEASVRAVIRTLHPAVQKVRDSEQRMSRKGAANPFLDELPEVVINS